LNTSIRAMLLGSSCSSGEGAAVWFVPVAFWPLHGNTPARFAALASDCSAYTRTPSRITIGSLLRVTLLRPRSRSRAGSPGAPEVCVTVSPGTRVSSRSVMLPIGWVRTRESTSIVAMALPSS
jgi:hypothetical protein